MKQLLHLEDSPHDAVFVSELVQQEWPQCRIERVAQRAAFHTALERGGFDLILSDFSLPSFDGLAAVDLARTLRPEIPFIFMSGTIGEERAVEALKRGAMDYVIKDRPERLISAIRQALKLVEESTARRRSEEALRLQQERHRLLFEHARDAIFIVSDAGELTALNAAFEDLTGWRREQWIGRHFRDLVYPDDRSRAFRRFEQALLAAPGELCELRLNTAAGPPVELEFALTPHVAGVGLMAIGRDVGERKRTLARLREQAEIIDHSPVAVVITDLAHRVTYANEGAARLYGFPREELVGQSAETIVNAEALQLIGPARDRALAVGTWRGEVPIRTRDGRDVVVEFFMGVIHDDAGRPKARLNVGVDVTERRTLELQLQRAARLDCIGLLASGIAHDLNNVLAPIQMGIDLLRDAVVDPMLAKVLRSMEAGTHHGTSLVRQLLAFARGGEIERVETALAPLVEDVRELLARTLPCGITLATECAPDLPPVLADGTQLKQVLLNLCINARDAMPHGGRLTLAVARATPAELARHAPAAATVPHVRLGVGDTGTGMPPEVLAKIFEPFFTTKETGKGTGLGLATVRSIVEKHGGCVVVDSQVGGGTTFHIFLPESPAVSSVAGTNLSATLSNGHHPAARGQR